MATDKQIAARERNHTILRLRGAYALFSGLKNSRRYGVAVDRMSFNVMTDIDQVLIAMGAESEAYRHELRMKRLKRYL